jgi:integrase
VCGCARRTWSKCPHDWHFNFTWRKRVHRFSLDRHLGRKLTGKTEADIEAEALRIAIRTGKFGTTLPQVATMSLRQLVALYIERAKAARPQDSVGVLHATALPRPTGGELTFGDWPIIDITTDTVERFREVRSVRAMVAREGQRVARVAGGVVAANRHLAFLRAVFNWAIRMGYVERTPFKRGTETVVKLKPELKRRRRLEPGEQERLLAACAPHVRLLVEAALETGCRIGELLSLQWSQVRFEPRADLFLPAQKTKTKRDRRIPMSSRLKSYLELRRTDAAGEAWPPSAYVFGNGLGQRIDSVDKAFGAACVRAGIVGLHFHDLRREAGSRWLEGGVPLQVVRDWLGHANVSQTSTYLATTSEGEYEAMRRFEAFQKTVASPCMTGSEGAPQPGTIGTDAGQESTENIDESRSDHDFGEAENRSVDGSIPPLATSLKSNKYNILQEVNRTARKELGSREAIISYRTRS